MSKQIQPLRRQMTPADHIRAKLLFTKLSIYVDLMDGVAADLKTLLGKYNLTHQKMYELHKLSRLSASFSTDNSKSLGYDMAVDFGELCDAISEGVDKLFIQKLHEQGESEQNQEK